jgi:hypothetical protein
MVLFLEVKVPNAFALAEKIRFEIMLVLKNESHNEINDHWTSKRKKRQVNKIHSDLSAFDA